MTTIEDKLKTMGLSLPEAPAPVANYVPTRLTGTLLFISGQVSRSGDGRLLTGKLGAGTDIAAGREAAKACALNVLAQARAALGSLDRIEAIVKLTGFVNSAPDFKDHPQVVNGASDLLVELLGDKGRHTRSAVGVAALPGGAAVEIEAIIAVAGEQVTSMLDRATFLRPIAHRGLHDGARGIIENTGRASMPPSTEFRDRVRREACLRRHTGGVPRCASRAAGGCPGRDHRLHRPRACDTALSRQRRHHPAARRICWSWPAAGCRCWSK